MNRWKWAALAVLVFGLLVAFVVLPYQPSCDDDGNCSNNGWRLLGILATLMVSFLLLVVGALSEPRKR